jgi:hypothetical protein
MSWQTFSALRRGIAAVVLLGVVLGGGVLLAAWKQDANREAAAAASNQPEAVEHVTLADAEAQEYHGHRHGAGPALDHVEE